MPIQPSSHHLAAKTGGKHVQGNPEVVWTTIPSKVLGGGRVLHWDHFPPLIFPPPGRPAGVHGAVRQVLQEPLPGEVGVDEGPVAGLLTDRTVADEAATPPKPLLGGGGRRLLYGYKI